MLEFAKFAKTLTVAASLKNANRVLLDDSIVHVMQKSVRRLTILSCNDVKSFPVMSKVVRNLVGSGSVRELCIGHCSLSSDMLKELLEYGVTDNGSFLELAPDDDSETTVSCTQDRFHDEDDSIVTDNSGNMSDLYDIALQPCCDTCLPIYVTSSVCRSCFSNSNRPILGGTAVQTLTLINLKSTSGSVDAVLCDVLTRLCWLEKLALIGLTEMHMTWAVNLCRTSQCLCALIQSGQLSHVIIDGCLLPPNFLSMLISALLQRCWYVLA